MNVKDLVKELVDEINSLAGALSLAKYREEKLEKTIEGLNEENKALQGEIESLKKKIDELEF